MSFSMTQKENNPRYNLYQSTLADLLKFNDNGTLTDLLPIQDHELLTENKQPSLFGKIQNYFNKNPSTSKQETLLSKLQVKALKKRFNHWHDFLSNELTLHQYNPHTVKQLSQIAEEIFQKKIIERIKSCLRNSKIENESLSQALNRLDQRVHQILYTPTNRPTDFGLKGAILNRLTPINALTQGRGIDDFSRSLNDQYTLNKEKYARQYLQQRFLPLQPDSEVKWQEYLNQEIRILSQKEEWEGLATCVSITQVREILRLLWLDTALEKKWCLDFLFNLPSASLLQALDFLENHWIANLNHLFISVAAERNKKELHISFVAQRENIIQAINDFNWRIDNLNEKLRSLTSAHQINYKEHIKPIFKIKADVMLMKNRFKKFQLLLDNIFDEYFYETKKLVFGFNSLSEIEVNFNNLLMRLDGQKGMDKGVTGMPLDIIHGFVFAANDLSDEDAVLDVLGTWNITKAQHYYKKGLLGNISQKEFYQHLEKHSCFKAACEYLAKINLTTIAQLKSHHIYNEHLLQEYVVFTANGLQNKDSILDVLRLWQIDQPQICLELGLLGQVNQHDFRRLLRRNKWLASVTSQLKKVHLEKVKDLKISKIFNPKQLSEYVIFHTQFTDAKTSIHTVLKSWKIDSAELYKKLGLLGAMTTGEYNKLRSFAGDNLNFHKIADEFLKKIDLKDVGRMKELNIYNKSLLRQFIRQNNLI